MYTLNWFLSKFFKCSGDTPLTISVNFYALTIKQIQILQSYVKAIFGWSGEDAFIGEEVLWNFLLKNSTWQKIGSKMFKNNHFFINGFQYSFSSFVKMAGTQNLRQHLKLITHFYRLESSFFTRQHYRTAVYYQQ